MSEEKITVVMKNCHKSYFLFYYYVLRSKYILHTQFFAFEYKNAMIVW